MSSIELGNILGVRVDAVDMQLVLDSINGWIDEPTYENVCVVPAHTVMDCRADPQLRRIVNASGLATPDGMSIVWLLKLQGFRDVERVYGPDLMQAACRFGLERGWRHFFYGGAGGVAAELVGRLTAEYSGLQVAGTYTPPFRQLTEEDDRHIVRAINDSGADIVWVGIGSPRQEYWMAEHLGRLQAPVMVGVGAAFDFLSGMKRQAPRWTQRSGLEWLFRFLSEPRRLWPRYRHYPKFVLLALAQQLHLLHFPIED